MSNLLLRASVPIRRDSSACRKESILKVLTEKTLISTRAIAFSEVDVSTLRLLLSVLKILRPVPEAVNLIAELELIPVRKVRLRKYLSPVSCIIRDYAVCRDANGMVSQIIFVR